MKKLFPLCIILLVISCQKPVPLLSEQAIGYVAASEGEATITRDKDKAVLPAVANTPLFAKDIIETKKGKAKVILNDESSFALSSDSKIALNEFYLDAAAGFRKSAVELAKGSLRSVVSKHFTGAGSEVNIETPTVIAGIRGTELAVTSEDEESSVYVLDGQVEVYKPAEPAKKVMVTKDMFIRAMMKAALAEPRPIPPEMRRMFFEEENYVPSGFNDRMKAFDEEYEAKKADMRAKEVMQKKKMEDKRENVKEKMKRQEDAQKQKGEGQRSKMDEKREEMEKRMKEKMRPKSTL